jgi:hypothetical protein
MRTLFTILFLTTVAAVSAQTKPFAELNLSKTNKSGGISLNPSFRDSIIKKLTTAGNTTSLFKSFPDTIVIGGGETPPIDNMPNAFTKKTSPPVYKGNNGHGFDIYESSIDGMPVLMPDSSNKASLDNGSVKKLQGGYQMPGSKIYMVPRGKDNKYR